MAMNKQRRTANINNIVTYDTIGNVTLPADLTIEGLTGAGFVKADANGLLSVDTAAYVTLNSTLSGYVVGPDSAISSSDTIIQAFGKIQGQLDALPNSNVITGTGTAGQVTYWTGANAIGGNNNLFWDNTNGRLGIGTNAPSYGLHISNRAAYIRPTNNSDDALHISNQGPIVFRGTDDAVTSRFRGLASQFQFQDASFNIKSVISVSNGLTYFNNGGGNVIIGGTTDNGQRLQVQGTSLLNGLSSINGAGVANVALAVYANGTGAGNFIMQGFDTSSNLRLRLTATGNFRIDGATDTGTSGDDEKFRMNLTFSPTSGTRNHYGILLWPTINQTGGANGITRGLYVNPTLTAAADWRSVEWSNNSGWGLYGAGTANNYLNGSLGIGSTSLTGTTLRLRKNMTGGVGVYAIENSGVIQSDVTIQAYYFLSQASTQAASFTLSNITHFIADQSPFGAGSTVTNQYGFVVRDNLTGATNNFGFYGNIPSGTNRWNLYCNGTANNYMAGSLGVGSTSLTGMNLSVNKNITGATNAWGVFVNGGIQTDVTSSARMVQASADAATGATVSQLYYFYARQGTFTGAVTNQSGFRVDANLTGSTNNYGFFGDIPSGSGRWNFFANGTAANYLNGNTIIGGSAVDGGQKLQVNGTAIFSDNVRLAGTDNVLPTGKNITLYNTSDETTNFERVRIYATSNVYRIHAESGGTGTRRPIEIGTLASGRVLITPTGAGLTGTFNVTDSGGGVTSLLTVNPGFTGTSTLQNNICILPTINQSSTAGYRGLWISPYQQATGSGTKLLIDAGTNTAATGGGTHTSLFSVNNLGDVYAASSVSIGTTTGVRMLNIFSSTGDTHVAVLGTAPSVALSDTATGATYQAKFGLATSANNFVTGSAAGDFVISNQAGNTIWAYNSVEGMRFTVNRNLLLGGTSDSGKKLQVTGEVNVTSGNATSIEISNTAGNYHLLMSSVSVAAAYGMYISGSDMLFTKTGAASPNITIKSTNGDVVFGNTIKTAAPTGGTSQAWKLGQYNATAPTATGYVEVEVNGTLYKLLAST